MCELFRIDNPNHYCLSETDECYYLGDYAARQGAKFSPMNQLIFNFKKTVDWKGLSDWKYKEKAIQDVAKMFIKAAGDCLSRATLVPIPPSKSKNDPLYDDRGIHLLKEIDNQGKSQLDIRELITQSKTITAAHENSSDRRSASDALAEIYRIEENLCNPAPANIIIFDDVITTGAHYLAMKNVLLERFPRAKTFGFFIARAVWLDG